MFFTFVHFSRLLGYRSTPLAVGRVINLKQEIIPVATKELLATFYNKGTISSQICSCHQYCFRVRNTACSPCFCLPTFFFILLFTTFVFLHYVTVRSIKFEAHIISVVSNDFTFTRTWVHHKQELQIKKMTRKTYMCECYRSTNVERRHTFPAFP